MKILEEFKNIQKEVPLSKYTTVGIGGPAEYLFIPENSFELEMIIKLAREDELQTTILGHGSNVLISDFGIRGLVIVNTKGKYTILDDTNSDTEVVCDSGYSLQKLSIEMFEKGLIGLEYFSGIPCSVGGAVYNNIHGVEKMFCDLIEWVEYLDTDNRVCKVTRDDCEFGYDKSTFQTNNGVILRACLKLHKGDGNLAHFKWDEIRKKKLEGQPQKSLGCVFKNLSAAVVLQNKFPTPSTGWYIQSVLKMTGYRIGDAKISERHHNFIENVGNASAKDYLKVIEDIQAKSENEFGITLETEIEMLGF